MYQNEAGESTSGPGTAHARCEKTIGTNIMEDGGHLGISKLKAERLLVSQDRPSMLF